jgi:hypothetical protein
MECAHDICTCLVEERAGYCSEACGMMNESGMENEGGVTTEGGVICLCGHAECRASRHGGDGL